MKNFFLFFILILPFQSNAKTFTDPRDTFELTFGTGDPSGLYYTFASTLGGILSKPPGSPACNPRGHCGIPGLIAHSMSTKGSVDNLDLLNTAKISTALVQSDVFYGKNYPNVYVVSPLYPEFLHIITKADAPFKSMRDLRGKNLAIGDEGSGTLYTTSPLLTALGFPSKNNQKLNLSAGLNALFEGGVDAVFIMAGAPLKILQDLSKENKIKLLSLESAEQKKLTKNNALLEQSTLQPGLYFGIDAITTLSVTALWVTAEQTSKNLSYDFLWSYGQSATKNLFKRANLTVTGLLFENILTRDRLKMYKDKLHPGALSYHRRRGLI